MVVSKVFGLIGLFVLLLLATSTQAVSPGRHRRHQRRQPDHNPSMGDAPATPVAEPTPAGKTVGFVTIFEQPVALPTGPSPKPRPIPRPPPVPNKREDEPQSPTEVFAKFADEAQPVVWRTPAVSPLPRPPGNPNKRDGDGEVPIGAFAKFADGAEPVAWRTPLPMPIPRPPPAPNAHPQEEDVGVFERFAHRSALMACDDIAGGSSSATPPSRSGVAESVLWFFLAAVGFFFLSLMWNLYFRFGLAKDSPKAIDNKAVNAMRMDGFSRPGVDRTAAGPAAMRMPNLSPPGADYKAASTLPTARMPSYPRAGQADARVLPGSCISTARSDRGRSNCLPGEAASFIASWGT